MAWNFQIGEIARFFDVPASTLRYWEDMGVVHPAKGAENHYREYSIEDLMTISDIVFYKNLGLQLKEIRGIKEPDAGAARRAVYGKAFGAGTSAADAHAADEETPPPYTGAGDSGGTGAGAVPGDGH